MRSNINPESLADEIVAGDVLKLRDISRRFKVDPSVVFRWMRRGLPNGKGERVKLAALRRGKCWLTSESAVKRFFSALEHSDTGPAAPPTRTSSQRERDSARAEATLKSKYGI